MASVKRTKDGTYEVRFFVNGVRQSFYPGSKATKRQAESIGIKLDKLAFAASQSESPPTDVGEWLVTLLDRQHNKLAAWGLVKQSEPRRCGKSKARRLDEGLHQAGQAQGFDEWPIGRCRKEPADILRQRQTDH